MKKTCGVLVIYGNKVMLCHPTNSSWTGTYGAPKGMIDPDEAEIDCAVREIAEETSIIVDKSKLDPNPIIIDYVNKTTVTKQLFLYVLRIKDLSEIGLASEVVPKEQLQLHEIDWCGFLTKEEAADKIFHRQKSILDMI